MAYRGIVQLKELFEGELVQRVDLSHVLRRVEADSATVSDDTEHFPRSHNGSFIDLHSGLAENIHQTAPRLAMIRNTSLARMMAASLVSTRDSLKTFIVYKHYGDIIEIIIIKKKKNCSAIFTEYSMALYITCF